MEDASEPDGRRSISGTIDILLRRSDVSDDCELGARRSRRGDLSLDRAFSFVLADDAEPFLRDAFSPSFAFSAGREPSFAPPALFCFRFSLRSRRSSSISRREVTLVPDKLNMVVSKRASTL